MSYELSVLRDLNFWLLLFSRSRLGLWSELSIRRHMNDTAWRKGCRYTNISSLLKINANDKTSKVQNALYLLATLPAIHAMAEFVEFIYYIPRSRNQKLLCPVMDDPRPDRKVQ